MSRELADMAMKIAEEKRTKAFLNNTYFQNDYEKEMQQEAIVAEAEERLNRDRVMSK